MECANSNSWLQRVCWLRIANEFTECVVRFTPEPTECSKAINLCLNSKNVLKAQIHHEHSLLKSSESLLNLDGIKKTQPLCWPNKRYCLRLTLELRLYWMLIHTRAACALLRNISAIFSEMLCTSLAPSASSIQTVRSYSLHFWRNTSKNNFIRQSQTITLKYYIVPWFNKKKFVERMSQW